jgi:hypothetical protein
MARTASLKLQLLLLMACLYLEEATFHNRSLQVMSAPALSWRERNKANPYIYNRVWRPNPSKTKPAKPDDMVADETSYDIAPENLTPHEVLVENGLKNGFVSSCYDKTCSTPWWDSHQNRIEAHGGGILKSKDGNYYWYGEAGKLLSQYGYGYSLGFNCYSSKDLQGPWKFEKMIFSQEDIQEKELVKSTRPFIMERPKIIYNAKYKTYVLWFHLDAADILDDTTSTDWQKQKKIQYKYAYRRAAVAVSSNSILGPYKYIHALLPNNEKCLDLQLYQEEEIEEGGVGQLGQYVEAYLVRSVNNKYVGITRLTDDYLNVVGNAVMMVKPALEAMTVFRHPVTSSLYAIMSHLTGWEPNPLVLLQAHRKGSEVACHSDCKLSDSLEWKHLGNPTRDRTSYNAQPTYTVRALDSTGRPYVMIMCDNWIRAGPSGLKDAGYIWLPLNLHQEASYDMVMKKLTNWSILDPFS